MLAVTVRCADRSAGDRASTAQYSTATLGCVRSAVRCFVGGYNGLAADSMASRAKSSLRHGVQPWTSFFGRRPRLDLSDAGQSEQALLQEHEAVGASKGFVAGRPSQGGSTAAIYATAVKSAADGPFTCSTKHAQLLMPTSWPNADAASTSYPASCFGSDVLGQCMTTAMEMEASVDSVLDGSIKSGQTMFQRYDMDLNGKLNQQDYYDMMLELNLALAVQDYQHFVDNTFNYADSDHDGLILVDDFVPVYRAIATARQAFKHQDHHHNGQIDRHDFQQVISELEVVPGQESLEDFAAAAFSLADGSGRGILNFGQVLWWYGGHLAAVGRPVQSKQSSTHTRPTALIG